MSANDRTNVVAAEKASARPLPIRLLLVSPRYHSDERPERRPDSNGTSQRHRLESEMSSWIRLNEAMLRSVIRVRKRPIEIFLAPRWSSAKPHVLWNERRQSSDKHRQWGRRRRGFHSRRWDEKINAPAATRSADAKNKGQRCRFERHPLHRHRLL